MSDAEYLDSLGAELVTYMPKGGANRQIKVIVNRKEPDSLGDAPHGHAPKMTIACLNDSTDGIASDEVNLGGDEIAVAERLGDTPGIHRITKILTQDSGMMQLELR